MDNNDEERFDINEPDTGEQFADPENYDIDGTENEQAESAGTPGAAAGGGQRNDDSNGLEAAIDVFSLANTPDETLLHGGRRTTLEAKSYDDADFADREKKYVHTDENDEAEEEKKPADSIERDAKYLPPSEYEKSQARLRALQNPESAAFKDKLVMGWSYRGIPHPLSEKRMTVLVDNIYAVSAACGVIHYPKNWKKMSAVEQDAFETAIKDEMYNNLQKYNHGSGSVMLRKASSQYTQMVPPDEERMNVLCNKIESVFGAHVHDENISDRVGARMDKVLAAYLERHPDAKAAMAENTQTAKAAAEAPADVPDFDGVELTDNADIEPEFVDAELPSDANAKPEQVKVKAKAEKPAEKEANINLPYERMMAAYFSKPTDAQIKAAGQMGIANAEKMCRGDLSNAIAAKDGNAESYFKNASEKGVASYRKNVLPYINKLQNTATNMNSPEAYQSVLAGMKKELADNPKRMARILAGACYMAEKSEDKSVFENFKKAAEAEKISLKPYMKSAEQEQKAEKAEQAKAEKTEEQMAKKEAVKEEQTAKKEAVKEEQAQAPVEVKAAPTDEEINRERQRQEAIRKADQEDERKMDKTAKAAIAFRGAAAFLSNMYNAPIEYNGVKYRCAEAAFQAQKDPSRAQEFADLDGAAAKRLGRHVKLREDWDKIKDSIMADVVSAKFNQNPELMTKLKNYSGELREENTWGDKYWGTVNGVGQNKLGKILTNIREEALKPAEEKVEKPVEAVQKNEAAVKSEKPAETVKPVQSTDDFLNGLDFGDIDAFNAESVRLADASEAKPEVQKAMNQSLQENAENVIPEVKREEQTVYESTMEETKTLDANDNVLTKKEERIEKPVGVKESVTNKEELANAFMKSKEGMACAKTCEHVDALHADLEAHADKSLATPYDQIMGYCGRNHGSNWRNVKWSNESKVVSLQNKEAVSETVFLDCSDPSKSLSDCFRDAKTRIKDKAIKAWSTSQNAPSVKPSIKTAVKQTKTQSM